MAIYAYNELYLEYDMQAMGTMLDYAVNYCHWEIDAFFQAFLDTDRYARQFECGDPDTVAGKSGVELYLCVTGASPKNLSEYIEFGCSPEYWVGWVLAFCQWHMNRTFRELAAAVPPSEMLLLYLTHHEMHPLHTVHAIKVRMKETPTHLERLRKQAGYSQAQLADLSTVPLRSIQMYEQRTHDISKAQFNVLNALAKVLHCSVYDLVDGI